jgi:hypothetical protein
MTKTNFKATPWAKNEATVIVVPAAYVKNGQIKQGTEYNVIFEEIKEADV